MKREFKLSKYNYFFSDGKDNYICNTFSGGIAKLEPGGKERLENFEKYTGELDDFYKLAIKNGYIINADVDEKEILNYYRTNMICTSDQAAYEILTTTGCNARCFYCFEEKVKVKTMSIETAKRVSEFIISRAKNTKRILIQWFGGEPLVNPDVITCITKELDENLKDKGVELVYKMATNGSLINDKILKQMKEVWHISSIQVTLDGMKNEYEKRKAYINMPNAFDKVIKNINSLAKEGIKVRIRLNYDLENFNNILNLIDYLGQAITDKKNVVCYAYPLFETGKTKSPDEREIAIKLIEINKRIIKNHLSKSKEIFTMHFSVNKCYACSRNSFLINPEGKLGKCSMALNEEDFIGDVWSPIPLNKNYLKWCSTELPSEECHSCKFLPFCQGGCKAGHLGYSPVKHYIYKNCFDDILLELVKAN